MNREQQRGSVWQGLNPPTPGVVLDKGHPRARGLLGFWWPGSRSFTGNSFARPNSAAIRFPDLSGYNRPAVFDRGPFAQQSLGAFVSTPRGPGFEIGSDGGQYGNFGVSARSVTDWNFANGEVTFMCSVSLRVLTTADRSFRCFVGRGDGAGATTSKWHWDWTGDPGDPNYRKFSFLNYEFGGTADLIVCPVASSLTAGQFYTFAMTKTAAHLYTFYLDGAKVGSASGTANFVIPSSTGLAWGTGEDFGVNILGTWLWMKAWNRALSDREVMAERWAPWAMLRLPYGVMEASTITTVGTCPFL